MNLINDIWIPVRRRSGKKEKIASWQVTDKYDEDPIIELAAVRPDFNGALIQFLIGLLQTTCAPQENKDWRKWLDTPPSPKELKEKFESVAFAFNLDGDGSRFMQDLTLEKENGKTTITVDKIFIDAPGEQTLNQNKDLFIKRGQIRQLCYSCCSQALLTLQINAPSGGAGHRVGLRGGGPVTTVILGDNVWQTTWYNILSENDFAFMANMRKTANNDRFPWMAATRTSEEDQQTTNQDIHPAQIFWPMPRRIRLITSTETGRCNLCNNESKLVKGYFTKPYGIKYDRLIHPLTPTYRNRDGTVLAVHQHELLGYKHWLGYVKSTAEGNEPARNVSAVLNRQIDDFRIWAFGYDMDNMKACCWYEGVMPVISIDNKQKREDFAAYVAMLINAANNAKELLSESLIKVFDPKNRKRKNHQALKEKTQDRFWQETETEFYKQMEILRQSVINKTDTLEVRKAWHNILVYKAEELFNGMSQADMIDMVDAARVSKAWNELWRNLYGRKLKTEMLGLP